MTPRTLSLVLGLAAATTTSTATARLQADPLAPLAPGAVPLPAPRPTIIRPTASAPAGLRDQISALVRGFDGKSGISVVSMRDGWQVDHNGGVLFPQQSCSKLWVAIAAMDAVDRGKVQLNDRVTLGRSDLTLFHQPIRAKILGGGHTTTLSALLQTAITDSDNTANDKLMRSIGGPETVRDMIDRKGLGDIRFYDGERALQSKVAGLIWSQSFSVGDGFYKARSALPLSVRRASFERYIDDPYDGASPNAVARALARLKRGELLSPASTRRLLSIMSSTKTGKMRVRAGLVRGWTWAHKTGTGQNFQGRVGGINDIGILTAPDGTDYAMSIMTVPNHTNGDAQQLMQSVARAVIATHVARYGG